MLTKWFCLYCSTAFLNAASLIVVVKPNDPMDTVISERGYETIRKVAAMIEETPGAYLRINQVQVRAGLWAETMIDGTTVCMDHAYDAEIRRR